MPCQMEGRSQMQRAVAGAGAGAGAGAAAETSRQERKSAQLELSESMKEAETAQLRKTLELCPQADRLRQSVEKSMPLQTRHSPAQGAEGGGCSKGRDEGRG
eukprot:3832693-Pleurochrysis_carterae.AAC.5